MTPLDDDILMANLAAGDREALRVLYERHAGFVYRVAFRYMGDEDDARDIIQSVFVSIAQSAQRYRPEGSLTTWIYRIAVNRCLNQRARAEHRLRVIPGDKDLENIPAADDQRPDRVFDRAGRAAEVPAAIARLPERQRMAIILRYFEDRSYGEIASALGCSRKSVESLLARARKSLAEYFSE